MLHHNIDCVTTANALLYEELNDSSHIMQIQFSLSLRPYIALAVCSRPLATDAWENIPVQSISPSEICGRLSGTEKEFSLGHLDSPVNIIP